MNLGVLCLIQTMISNLLTVKSATMLKRLPLLIRFFTSCVIFIGISSPVVGQNLSQHNWYFGNSNQAIRFNRANNSPTLTTKAIPFGTGGSAVATDPVNGNLLFYTDGNSIYDITNSIMPSGTGLGANTAGNQPVAIAREPGQPNRYYIFTNTANFTTGGNISYRIVDMTLFGNAAFPTPALGDAVGVANTAVGGLTGRSEAMITVPHANGEDFWLITHANGSPDYAVTLFTATGPGATTFFNGFGLIEVAANFSYHAASGRIAVSPQETTRDVETINFDNTNGTISAGLRILNTGVLSTTSQAIYDVEWSNRGRFLYISRHGEAGIPADVFQYDLTSSTTSLASVLPQPNTISRSYGLQMAPDSAIYHLYQATAGGPFVLGSLTNTDTVASQVVYNPAAFSANPNFNGMQFSAFAPKDTIQLSVSFTTRGTCSNTPTSFYPTVTPGADSLVWDFGDGQTATGWSPVHTYESGSTFNVRLRAYLRGDTTSVVQPVNITQFDLQLTLVQDTTACACELPINNGKGGCPNDTSDDFAVTVQAQGGSPSYQWFGPGGILGTQTSATLRPDSAGYYYVVATLGGCSAYAGVNIKEYDSLDQRANIWYFGQNAGIDFNSLPDPPLPISGPLNTPEGTSVISDRNGQVIFSTDGQHIYDKSNTDITPAPVPPGIGGDPGASQSALIIPVPTDETLYYIFTTQEVHGTNTYELRYSLFDLKLNSGLGGLAEYNKLLFSRSTERITGNANWLIAHEYGNNSFRAYEITAQGISNPIISSIGSDHSVTSAENGQGYMKLGPQNRLAVALSTPGTANVVEIFDFVDSTGQVINYRVANLNSATGQVYGIEFSPGGNKLFATLKSGTSRLFEFAFDSLSRPYFKQSVNQNGEYGALQIGPDGQIYAAINGSTNLGTFTANEDTTQLSAITALQQFALAPGTQSTLGLPNFIQNISNPAQTPGFNFTGVCLGDSTSFTASGKDPAIDKFDWFFGDGQAVTDGGAEVSHRYATAGTYTVTLRIYNKCETPVGTYVQQIVINGVPANPSTATVLCTGPATLDANPGDFPGLTYAWSTSETTETIVVNQQGQYTVAVTNAAGCTTTGTILATDNRPILDFGPDITVCQNTVLPSLNALNPGATYAWTVNNVASGTARTQPVTTATPGLFEYKVRVTDPVTTCFARDSITYTVKESPAFTAIPGPPIACLTSTGEITVNITAPSNTLFSYFVTGPSPAVQGIDQSLGSISTGAILSAGTYGVTVSDQVSGCATTTTASINNNTFTVAGTANATCDPIGIAVTTTPVQGALSYRVIDNSTAVAVETGNATGNFSTDAAGLPSNNASYVVEINAAGCIATSPIISIDEAPTVQSTFTLNTCVNPIVLTADNPGSGVTWSGPGITTTETGTTIIISNVPQGNQTYTIRITDPVLCALDTVLTVNVNNDVTADFTQSDPCADQVILSATPTGAYTYRWYREVNLIPGGGGQSISVGVLDNNVSYRVDIVNAISGCIFSSQPQPVLVTGIIDVSLTTTTPCEGSPFTLTATATPNSATFQWERNGSILQGQSASTLEETRDGAYRVTASISGCSDSEEFDIALAPVTPSILPGVAYICPAAQDSTREAVLNPGEYITYNWSTSETTPTITVTARGRYRVDLVNSYGCETTDEIEVFEDCNPRITGPNAFRPGGNNREFFLYTFFIDDIGFEIFIFNRWGEMIYQSNERDFKWNGGHNNNLSNPLPPGTYTYVVKYKSSYRPEKGTQEHRGGVVLLR
jgi:gliding motility-associated-like protein